GIHQADVARWGLGVTFPSRVSATGGHFMFNDDQETPNVLNCTFTFEEPGGRSKMMEVEVRPWLSNDEAGGGWWGLPRAERDRDALLRLEGLSRRGQRRRVPLRELAWRQTGSRAARQVGPRSFRELRQLRPHPECCGPARPDRRRPCLVRAGPSRERVLSARQNAAVRSRDRACHRRRGGEPSGGRRRSGVSRAVRHS